MCAPTLPSPKRNTCSISSISTQSVSTCLDACPKGQESLPLESGGYNCAHTREAFCSEGSQSKHQPGCSFL